MSLCCGSTHSQTLALGYIDYQKVFHWIAIYLSPPKCRCPVGDGANLTLTDMSHRPLSRISESHRKTLFLRFISRGPFNWVVIVVLKVATSFLLRISLKPSSYGKVNEATVTSFVFKKKEYKSQVDLQSCDLCSTKRYNFND